MATLNGEIDRIEQAKADIKQAIIDKGVEVNEEKIDEYAELISQIKGGGGGTYGTVTYKTDEDGGTATVDIDMIGFIGLVGFPTEMAGDMGGSFIQYNSETIFFSGVEVKRADITEVYVDGAIERTPNNFLALVNKEQYGMPSTESMYESLKKVTLGEGIVETGDYFLSGFYAVYNVTDLEIVWPTTIKKIGKGFLRFVYNYDRPIEFPDSIEEIGGYFLSQTSYNHPIKLPKNLTVIPEHSMYSMSNFNSTITFPEKLTRIERNSLCMLPVFNQPIELPPTLERIEGGFLQYAYEFDQPITFPEGMTYIGDNSLDGVSKMTGAVVIPDTVEYLGYGFMNGYAGTHPITLPAALKELDGHQMHTIFYNMSNFTGPLIVNCEHIDTFNDYAYVLSVGNNTYPAYTQGITVTGPHAQEFMEKFPNRTSNPYRKLVLGE